MSQLEPLRQCLLSAASARAAATFRPGLRARRSHASRAAKATAAEDHRSRRARRGRVPPRRACKRQFDSESARGAGARPRRRSDEVEAAARVRAIAAAMAFRERPGISPAARHPRSEREAPSRTRRPRSCRDRSGWRRRSRREPASGVSTTRSTSLASRALDEVLAGIESPGASRSSRWAQRHERRTDRTGQGSVRRVNGPVVDVVGLDGVAMFDVVAIGEAGLAGEIVSIDGDVATAQVYEYDGGVAPGDPRQQPRRTSSRSRWDPACSGGVFDGILRPLEPEDVWLAAGRSGDAAAGRRPGTSRRPRPSASMLPAGALLGRVTEGEHFEHRVLVPPDVDGVLHGCSRLRAMLGLTNRSRASATSTSRSPTAGRSDVHGRLVRGTASRGCCAPDSVCSTFCTRSPAAAARRCRVGSAPARRCCCSRSPSGATPT